MATSDELLISLQSLFDAYQKRQVVYDAACLRYKFDPPDWVGKDETEYWSDVAKSLDRSTPHQIAIMLLARIRQKFLHDQVIVYSLVGRTISNNLRARMQTLKENLDLEPATYEVFRKIESERAKATEQLHDIPSRVVADVESACSTAAEAVRTLERQSGLFSKYAPAFKKGTREMFEKLNKLEQDLHAVDDALHANNQVASRFGKWGIWATILSAMLSMIAGAVLAPVLTRFLGL